MLTPSIAMAVLYTTYLLKFPIMNYIFFKWVKRNVFTPKTT